MFPLPILTYIKIAVVVAALAFAYYKGYSGEHEKFVKFQAEVAALGKAQELVNEQKVKEHEYKAGAIKDEYEGKLAAVSNYYSERLLDSSASVGSLPPVSKPAVCPNAAPTHTVPARQCAETTLQLVQLQKWINGVK